MKKAIYLFMLLATYSCKKEYGLPATVNIEVSYYYNAYQGYKPDIGAIAFLCEKNKTTSFHNDSTSSIFIRFGKYSDKYGKLVDIPYKYKQEAGVSGIINIQNVDPGEYLVLLTSKGRYTYSHKYITINSGDNVELVKNFYYLHDYEYGGELW